MKAIILGILLMSNAAQASWSCALTCEMEVTKEFLSMDQNSSANQIADFRAECNQVKGQVTGPQCGRYHCTETNRFKEDLYGVGTSLTEARERARKKCAYSPNACGGDNTSGKFSESSYNCRQF